MASRLVLILATGGVFVAAAVIRRDAAAALLGFGILFAVLEHLYPRRSQPVIREGLTTDCVHFLVDELLAATILSVVLALVVPTLDVAVPRVVSSTLHAQPSWLLIVEGLFVAEIAGYWGHRASHEIEVLWRFHRLHHSIETMDWLAPNRRHPVDMAFARASVILPLVAMGFPLPAIVAPFAIRRFQGVLVHANIRLNAGPLTWLIATPEFHHWHHADHSEAYNRNYAGQLPLVDWLFGTLYLPRPSWPSRYGCGEAPPAGYFAQLAWPLRRVPAQAPASSSPSRDHDQTDGTDPTGSRTTPAALNWQWPHREVNVD